MAESTRDDHAGATWAALIGSGGRDGNPNTIAVCEDWPAEGDALLVLACGSGPDAVRPVESALRTFVSKLNDSNPAGGIADALRQVGTDAAKGWRAPVSFALVHLARGADATVVVVGEEARGFWLGLGTAQPLASRPLAGAPPVILLTTPHLISAVGDAGMRLEDLLALGDNVHGLRDTVGDQFAPLLSPDAAALFFAR